MSRPRAASTTPQFSFRLDPSLRADLELLAKNDDRTLGYYIERVMREHRDANLARVNALRKAAGLPLYPEIEESAFPAAAEDATPSPPHSSAPGAAAEEEQHIESMLEEEQKKKDSAPPAPKPARQPKAGS